MQHNEDNRLFLLDAMALIYRSYYAFIKRPIINSKGLNTSAIYGFTNTVIDLINREKPTHMGVAFDTLAPTERHIDFVDYKGTREETPEDIVKSLPYIESILKAFNIPILKRDGYEADDIIGTLAKEAEEAGYVTYMVTSDKDFGQLVSDRIFMYKPARIGSGFEVLGIQDILKKWSIKKPEQVIDILALMGDSSDNIPGIPGVGEKTAMKLIGEYGSLEAIVENADKLKGKLKDKVKENAELAQVCYKLATIITDVPVEFNPDELSIGEFNKEELNKIFSELEFRTLGKRILGDDFSIGATNGNGQMDLFAETEQGESNQESKEIAVSEFLNLDTVKHNYILVDSEKKVKQLIKTLEKEKIICFDTETTGLDPHNCELVGLSFSCKRCEAYYVPVPEDQKEAKQLLENFKVILENEGIEKVGQNIKYDIQVLKWYGIEVKGELFDTMLAHYLIEPDMRHNMSILAETYLNYSVMSIETLIGKKGKKQLNMRDIEVKKIAEYAAEDADITLQLKNVLEPDLKEKNATKLFYELEIPLLKVLSDMEYEGVAIDKKALADYSQKLAKEIVAVEEAIYEIAGVKFNIASPKQLGEVLFDKLKIPYSGKKTKTGQYVTNEEMLLKLAREYEIASKIIDSRQLNKLKSTYVDALPKLINTRTGRVHTTFNQTIAATGRLSSVNPNLQNIPIRTEKGREVRRAFISRNDAYVLLSADYSQVELRLVTEVSKDDAMMDAFRENLDIHAATAARVYGVKLDEVTSEMRSKAKMVNFGIIYGISAFGLSQRLGISRTEAKELIDNYFDKYPGIKKYMDETIAFARKHGYVETILGRRRYLRDINSGNATVRGFAERNAINAPIQGSAADMIKIAMIKIHEAFQKENLQSRMTLQVHDELIFDVHKDEVETVKQIVEHEMCHAFKTEVPIIVEMGVGLNWLEAH